MVIEIALVINFSPYLAVEKPVESMVTSRKNGSSSESSGSSSDSEAEGTGN